jgi:molecular chaperone GrpE (heat shock protein)
MNWSDAARLKEIYPWMKRQWTVFDEKWLLPSMIRTSGYLRKKIQNRIRKYHLIANWKETVFDDFSAWLAELPEKPGVGTEDADGSDGLASCDLFTVLSEFTALRQEIRIQSREQGKILSTLTGFIDAYQETADLFKDRTKALADLEANIRKSTEKRTILPFLEVRDALVRGLSATHAVSADKGFFRRAPRGIEGVVEGYEMALRRIDRALAFVHVVPIAAVGQPFDPKTMKAVDKRIAVGMEKGMVVEELLTGFLRDEDVLRTAEVVVCG